MRGSTGSRAGVVRAGVARAGVVLVATGLVVAVCGAGPAVAGDGGLPAAAGRAAPVQACPDEPLGPGLPSLPPLPASVPVPDPVSVPPGAAVFGARYPGEVRYLVAPGDWTCDVVFFSGDGGEQAYVHPGPPSSDPLGAQYTSLVQAVFNSGGVQTDVDLACPFISQATDPPQPGGQPGTCLAQPRQGADRLHVVPTGSAGLLATAVGVPAGVREPNLAASAQAPPSGQPDKVVALVTLTGPGGTAQEVGCAVPGPAAVPTCQASLGLFLADSAVGQELSPPQLAAAVADLNAFVASYLA